VNDFVTVIDERLERFFRECSLSEQCDTQPGVPPNLSGYATKSKMELHLHPTLRPRSVVGRWHGWPVLTPRSVVARGPANGLILRCRRHGQGLRPLHPH